jgi:hypothetical protein
MNIAVRDVTPAHCTRTQHIELRLATVDDASAIAQLISAWFPMTIWQDCLSFDAVKAASFIARGIASGCQPFILALDRPTKNFRGPDSAGNTIQELNLVGCISWHLDARFTEPIGVLDEVFVVPRLRRSDLGRRLIGLAMHISKEEGAKVFNFPVASGMPEQVSLINMLTRHIGAEPVGVILRKVL